VVKAANQGNDGLVLKKDRGGWWVEINDELARDKVMQSFTSGRLNQQQRQRRTRKKERQRGVFQFCV
jgi:hypothetical protein